MTRGIGGHQKTRGSTDEWLTPRALLDALGPRFGLDPCASSSRPWPTARRHWTRADDGLHVKHKRWFTTRPRVWPDTDVWLNPPYSRVAEWMARISRHRGGGVALVFARTETDWFQRYVLSSTSNARALYFIAGRISFCHPDGREAEDTSGGPSVLVGYGDCGRSRLEHVNSHDGWPHGRLVYLG